MCETILETMQSSHRLRPAMTLVRALLAPTASGDGAGPGRALLCATAAFASLFRSMSKRLV
jgi:hypothetical protein